MCLQGTAPKFSIFLRASRRVILFENDVRRQPRMGMIRIVGPGSILPDVSPRKTVFAESVLKLLDFHF